MSLPPEYAESISSALAKDAHTRRNGKAVDRYEGRHVDLGPLLAAPAKATPWRVTRLAADGTVTIISAEAGAGKSWLAQALCTGVARGTPVVGLPCQRGCALYVDAEMGPEMFVNQRLRPAGITEPEFEYIDAMGLDVSLDDDLDWLRGKVIETEAKLVVIDSPRRLVPSKCENDSDDMAPTVAAIAKLARDTSAAIVLIHHKGDLDKFYRGSTAIKDQADALFALLRPSDQQDDGNPVRRLRCRGGKGKMRYAPEPPDVHLMIAPAEGGVIEADPPQFVSRMTEEAPSELREAIKQDIVATLPAKNKTAVAAKIDRRDDDRTFRAAWAELEHDGLIVKENGCWKKVVVTAGSLGGHAGPQLFDCVCEIAHDAAPDGRCGRCFGVISGGEGARTR